MQNTERLSRALTCLEGLSMGDAFGQLFFSGHPSLLQSRILPPRPWPFTDDTQMAMSVVSELRQHDGIDQDRLARSFAEQYESRRGYGPAMRGLLTRIGAGEHWKEASQSLFSGQGSFGNGAAMRVAPAGAYFADELDSVVEPARRSAEVTHAHPEGVAGAIAVALAAALAWQLRESRPAPEMSDFLKLILPRVPLSQVRRRLLQAADLGGHASVESAISLLGNGSGISAQDTVPFALWCAGQHLDRFEEALWFTAGGGGDYDTNCAIVGGIVVLCAGIDSIPETWRRSREELPDWPFQDHPE